MRERDRLGAALTSRRALPLATVTAVALSAGLAAILPGVSPAPAPAASTAPADTAPQPQAAPQPVPAPAPVVKHAAPAPLAPASPPPARAEIVATSVAPAQAHTSALPPPNTTTVRYGPIPVLPALLGTPVHTTAGVPLVSNIPLLPMPCTDCYVTGTTIDMVYEDGRQANLDTGVMLHHLVLFQPDREDATCPRGSGPVGALGQRVFAAGNERTPGTLPEGYGVPFGQGPLGVIFEIMNHSPELKLVYITATITWHPGSTQGIEPVIPVWLDQNNCSTSQFAVPAGQSVSTWRWRSPYNGRFVAAGGHVHDGGVKIAMRNDRTGELMCSSVAGYATKPAYMGSIDSMSVCSWDRIGSVRAGDEIVLETTYNTPVAQHDAMGIMISYLYQTESIEGGTQAPASMIDPGTPSAAPPPSHHHH